MLLMDEPFNPSRVAPSVAQALASDFARKWTSYQGNEVLFRPVSRIGHFQAHFNELCEIVGHENPHDDLNNRDFEFNQRVRTATESQGEADVFLRDHFIMEYKKLGLDLDAGVQPKPQISQRISRHTLTSYAKSSDTKIRTTT